jgi:hypothetical protein
MSWQAFPRSAGIITSEGNAPEIFALGSFHSTKSGAGENACRCHDMPRGQSNEILRVFGCLGGRIAHIDGSLVQPTIVHQISAVFYHNYDM